LNTFPTKTNPPPASLEKLHESSRLIICLNSLLLCLFAVQKILQALIQTCTL
jgi:hypothetical protein